jgi:hypothetical protein
MFARCFGLAAFLATWTFLARAEAPSLKRGAPAVLALPDAVPVLQAPHSSPVASLSVSSAIDPTPARSALPTPPSGERPVIPSSEAPLVPAELLTSGGVVEAPIVLLPIPVPPPKPAQPTTFEPPAQDLAAEPARAIARRVANFRAYRTEIPGATWRVDEAAVFRVRADAKCKRALRAASVPAHLVERELLTPVPSPVALDGPVAGVTFRSLHADREVEMACELAVRLPAIAEILKRHGVRSVNVLSSYREQPRTSFHTFGLALDLASFRTDRGVLVVSKHFEATPSQLTCDAQPSSEEGRILLAIACDLAASNLVSSLLTPNYNEGHRDHFHLDIRPDDPRVFLR